MLMFFLKLYDKCLVFCLVTREKKGIFINKKKMKYQSDELKADRKKNNKHTQHIYFLL